jgi:glycine/D-amino acid oxidase-like deaminating enzyme/Fe-S-cluster-containing hydrogenase component 2
MIDKRLKTHPILDIPDQDDITFFWRNNPYKAQRGAMISAALYANGFTVFGHHHRDDTAQGIFCANGQCSKCMVIADGFPVKSCMNVVSEGMRVEPADGLPALPYANQTMLNHEIPLYETEVLIIGGGPSGLSAAIEFEKNNIKTILIDDKNHLGGKLILQTHKFFGSIEDSHAGTRGIDIGHKLEAEIRESQNIEVWVNSTALYVFKDKVVGVLRGEDYVLVKPKVILNAAGAREKYLRFPGNTLVGIYGAGAFQTLVNRDLVKSSQRLFIVGGGNVGLIAGYHAMQAGIEVVGLVEAMPTCGGYKVHSDKLSRLGVPIYTSHTIISANGDEEVESVTIARLDDKFQPIAGTELSFSCDTILIAVGLDSLSEFTETATTAGIPVYATGDAHEIAEASSAMFNGKIVGVQISAILKGTEAEIPLAWYEKAEVLKSHPGKLHPYQSIDTTTGLVPIIHCLQEIPCNPCTTSCPTNSIKIFDDTIMGQPIFDGSCIGCSKCLLICPGLAISLVDYRKDEKNPIVSIPYELSNFEIKAGDIHEVVDISGSVLGRYPIESVVSNQQHRTQILKLQLPSEIAKRAISVRIQPDEITKPLARPVLPEKIDDSTMVCICERVSVGEVKHWIECGVTDVNQLKGITRLGMGACGSKTCDHMIKQVFRSMGVAPDQITSNSRRPLFIEVQMEKFNGLHPVIECQNDIVETTQKIETDISRPISQNPINFDVIVIGAGSIGVPATMNLAGAGHKVLCIESEKSPGQVNNKKAIGGVRATHSDFGKITTCLRSIEIFSNWKEEHGTDIGWMSNGYSFPAYDKATEHTLKDLLRKQNTFGLNISWISADEYCQLIPGISKLNLRGGTYSPDDGSCSPLLAVNAFYMKSLEYGAKYRFAEKVLNIVDNENHFIVTTDKGIYKSDYVINAAGNNATEISKMLGIECHVVPDSHEAAITEPVQRFIGPMVVDLRGATGSKNYYFYQNNEGQIVFCITPDPIIYGTDNDATSDFLPICTNRMLQIFPMLKNLKVRRQWRGQYPMTLDGFPIIGFDREHPKFIEAVGMCGQGFMLGPGVGELLERLVSGTTTQTDIRVLESFDPYRSFTGMETFK